MVARIAAPLLMSLMLAGCATTASMADAQALSDVEAAAADAAAADAPAGGRHKAHA